MSRAARPPRRDAPSNPFVVAAAFYALALIVALVWSALGAWDVIPSPPGLRWLRVHFLTLGVVGQLVVGGLSRDAFHRGSRRRWALFTAWNLGVAALAHGVPAVSRPVILTGGTLALVTLLWLGITLARRPDTNPARAFESAAIAFLAIGAIVGTGIWLGWSGPLRIASAREAHIHANVWGFASMIFASWLARYATAAAVSNAVARSLRAAFPWLAAGGALLVAGPWIGSNPIMAAGLVAYAVGTLRLLAATRSALREAAAVAGATPYGARHVWSAYAWLAAPLVGAPFVVMAAGSPVARAVESDAPQAVIFGWLLPLAIAWGPWIASHLVNRANARLGGTRLSFWAANIGVLVWWGAIFAPAPVDGALRGLALALVAVAVGAATLRGWRDAAAAIRSDVDAYVV